MGHIALSYRNYQVSLLFSIRYGVSLTIFSKNISRTSSKAGRSMVHTYLRVEILTAGDGYTWDPPET
jgi:hypothetical protein